MDYPWATPGTWVECIRDDWSFKPGVSSPQVPQKGGHYRITKVVSGKYGGRHPLYLELEGFDARYIYSVTYFRPLLDKDIELFREIAARPPDFNPYREVRSKPVFEPG